MDTDTSISQIGAQSYPLTLILMSFTDLSHLNAPGVKLETIRLNFHLADFLEYADQLLWRSISLSCKAYIPGPSMRTIHPDIQEHGSFEDELP